MKETGNSQAMIDRQLTGEEKELLDRDEFMTKQKERMGKSKADPKSAKATELA